MANMVASPLLRMLSDRLSSLIDNSFDMKSFQLTLAEIQTLVLDAENKPEEEDALRRWLTEVKDAAYEADDLLDEFNGLSTFRVSIFLFPYQWLLRFKLQRKMKDIELRLNALLDRRIKFQKAAPLVIPEVFSSFDGNINFKVPHRETRSSISESEIFGRKEDKLILMDRLLSHSDTQFKVVPIVGMGGLGKTTLAQLIYNDERVEHEFDRRYWVSVSQTFDVRMIGKAIMEKKTPKASRILVSTEETIDAMVGDELKGRRFLIVLDDVWNENQEKWDVLQRWFTVGAHGSAVLLTTRSTNVADLIGTVEPYNLKPLSDDDGWLLFKHVAFSSKDEENIELFEIGKRLVDRCKGLPLAIRTLAGLMRFKREESEWLQIKDDNLWELPEFGSSVLPALRLSYNHLPSHLKQCFAYCSIFPQGITIGKERLIQLWIAEGFIQSSEGSRSLEDIGNECFMELWRRSFFVEIWRDDSGEIVKCQMHYLIHDLARSVASIGCSIMESSTLQNVPEDVRHSSLVYDSDDQQPTMLQLLQKAKKLRTLLLFSSNLEKIPKLLLKLRSLRALDLSGSGILKLSKSVARLTHLRYLNLSRTHIERLPYSIGKLQSLNTLELIECYNLQELPNSICELTNLRHLDIQSCCSLSHMPSQIGKLRLLQKLPLFILSNIDGCSDISELGELHLRGKLEIKNLEFVVSPVDAENAKLHDKQNLRSLKLSWSHDAEMSAEMSFEILEKLMPSQELKVLHIIDYKGKSYPSWMMNSLLQNLAKVSLVNCSCEKLPPLGQLPNLKYLYIKKMLAVKIIDYAFYGGEGTAKRFPSLRHLELYDMPNLKEWWSFRLNKQFGMTKTDEESSSSASGKSIEAFPCLEFLTIKGCSNLTRLPEIPNLKSLALWNCNEELLLSLDRLISLSTLVINEFRKPLVIPMQNLISIKKITIYDCDDLLAQLDDDIQYFSSVEHLRILYCDSLKLLPLGLGHLTSLKKLEIAECRELAYVPDIMQNLHSLREFIIDGCPKLKSLPNSISLIKLEKLVIRRCPELNKQLDIENSEEWSKIAHIPRIEKEIEEYVTEEEILSES